MPKMKTKSGAKKRFRVRGSGSVKRSQAFKRHILTKKSTKSKRQLRGSAEIHDPAYRRLRHRRDLDQIELRRFGLRYGFTQRDDPKLFAFDPH